MANHIYGDLEIVDVYVEDIGALMDAPLWKDCEAIIEADSPTGDPTRYYVVRAADNPRNY